MICGGGAGLGYPLIFSHKATMTIAIAIIANIAWLLANMIFNKGEQTSRLDFRQSKTVKRCVSSPAFPYYRISET